MKRRGDYFLGMEHGEFINTGMKEPRLQMDHMLMLEYISREGVTRKKIFRRGIKRWSILISINMPQQKKESTFDKLKDSVDGALWPTMAWVD